MRVEVWIAQAATVILSQHTAMQLTVCPHVLLSTISAAKKPMLCCKKSRSREVDTMSIPGFPPPAVTTWRLLHSAPSACAAFRPAMHPRPTHSHRDRRSLHLLIHSDQNSIFFLHFKSFFPHT